MAIFTESFDKADGALGPNLTWASLQSAPQIWEVTGNQASPRGATRGLVEYARAEHDLDGSDHYAQVVVTALSAGSQGGPCVRFAPAAATFYGVEVFGNGDVSIQRVVAGTRTAIGSGTVTVTLPAVLRLEVAGDTLTAFWAGVQCATAVDPDIAGGIRGGIMGFEQTGQGLGLVVDSFEAGDLGAAGITGMLDVTEAVDTLAAVGTHTPPPVTGSVAVTEAADSLAASGTVTAAGITGTVSVTEQADILDAAGAITPPILTGSLAATEAADTLAAAGTVTSDTVAGSIDATEGVDTLAAVGTFTPGIVSGMLNVTEANDVLAATGIHTAPVTGALAAVEAADQLAAAGTVDNSSVVAPAPPERTFMVPAEDRRLTVAAEPRQLVVAAESRTLVVS